jgi:predicted PurR-regulated permease PerM
MNVPPPVPRIIVPIADGADRRRLSKLKRDVSVIRFAVVGLFTIAALVIGAAAGGLLAPTAIAVILALVLAPLSNMLERVGLPAGAAALLIVGGTMTAIVFGAAYFAPSMTDLSKEVPQLIHAVEGKLAPLMKQIAAFESAQQQIATVPGAPAAHPVPVTPTTPGAFVTGSGVLETVASTAPNIMADILYVAVLAIFLMSERRRYTEQLILLPHSFAGRVRMARICRDVKDRVSGYLSTLSLINLGLAVSTAVAFWFAGIPNGILWGVAYGLLNFVPIIGPTTIMICALLVGFATEPTLARSVLPFGIIIVIDTIEAYFLQPWLLSRRLVVSPIGIFVTLATLVWMWGAFAAITAVPVLILVHTVMSHIPNLRPFARLLATEHDHGGHAHNHLLEPRRRRFVFKLR